jgi:hypothetical protein
VIERRKLRHFHGESTKAVIVAVANKIAVVSYNVLAWFSAKGAVSYQPGAPPRNAKRAQRSAESVIQSGDWFYWRQAEHLSKSIPSLRQDCYEMNRAYSAGYHDSTDPGAMPQAQNECRAFGAKHLRIGNSADRPPTRNCRILNGWMKIARPFQGWDFRSSPKASPARDDRIFFACQKFYFVRFET